MNKKDKKLLRQRLELTEIDLKQLEEAQQQAIQRLETVRNVYQQTLGRRAELQFLLSEVQDGKQSKEIRDTGKST